ncbi:MAG TPA: PqqD family protein [Longimicrobiales bacterium]|nr:PqqD family protein [Longimicrobiales bacterium]
MSFDQARTPSPAASSAANRLVPAKHVVVAVHGTRTVLLDPRRGRYYGLDEVGGRVWTLAGENLSAQEIIDRLSIEYDVQRDRLEADVLALVNDMVAKRLLEPI